MKPACDCPENIGHNRAGFLIVYTSPPAAGRIRRICGSTKLMKTLRVPELRFKNRSIMLIPVQTMFFIEISYLHH
jgi:hypothetical protein